eukprot:6478160-Amphidinium_carterae.4
MKAKTIGSLPPGLVQTVLTKCTDKTEEELQEWEESTGASLVDLLAFGIHMEKKAKLPLEAIPNMMYVPVAIKVLRHGFWGCVGYANIAGSRSAFVQAILLSGFSLEGNKVAFAAIDAGQLQPAWMWVKVVGSAQVTSPSFWFGSHDYTCSVPCNCHMSNTGTTAALACVSCARLFTHAVHRAAAALPSPTSVTASTSLGNRHQDSLLLGRIGPARLHYGCCVQVERAGNAGVENSIDGACPTCSRVLEHD